MDYIVRGRDNIPKSYRVNDQITAQSVLLVDDEGNQLGELTTEKALEMAVEKGLDLVEVAPAAKPPVCRLLNYGKFRYEATRKEREARKASKSKSNNAVREVRMKTRIGDHDREAKTRLVKRLLGVGSKVRVSVMFRGREVQHPQILHLLPLLQDQHLDQGLCSDKLQLLRCKQRKMKATMQQQQKP